MAEQLTAVQKTKAFQKAAKDFFVYDPSKRATNDFDGTVTKFTIDEVIAMGWLVSTKIRVGTLKNAEFAVNGRKLGDATCPRLTLKRLVADRKGEFPDPDDLTPEEIRALDTSPIYCSRTFRSQVKAGDVLKKKDIAIYLVEPEGEKAFPVVGREQEEDEFFS